MKKIIPLIFSVLSVITSNAQAVGGWGTCEFADVATMNAFDPSTNAYDCKKVFVQATNDHYYWDGTIWVLVTDDQNASEVPFTPVGTIVATDVQAAIAEIEPDIYGSIDVHDDVDVTTNAPSNGDVLSWDGFNFVPFDLSSFDNFYNTDGTLGEDRLVEMDGNSLTFDGSGTGDVIIEADGDVGIGTTSPDARLTVSNGKVKFTDYGSGSTIGMTPTYYLGVTAAGEVVELSSTGSFPSLTSVNVTSITFSGTQNNWTPTGFTSSPFYNVYRITSTSNVNIRGINSTDVVDGQLITLMNIGSNRLRFQHQNTSATAANRLITPQGNNKDVNNGEVITFIYDATSARWRVFSTGN